MIHRQADGTVVLTRVKGTRTIRIVIAHGYKGFERSDHVDQLRWYMNEDPTPRSRMY